LIAIKEDGPDEKDKRWNKYLFPLRVQLVSLALIGQKIPVKIYRDYYGSETRSVITSPVLEAFKMQDWRSPLAEDKEPGNQIESRYTNRFNHSSFISESEIYSFANVIRNSSKSFNEIRDTIAGLLPRVPIETSSYTSWLLKEN
jgi:hypothetical protein